MRVIGIHDGHNASVAYVEQGILKHAVQEERFNLIKNYWGFPRLSLEFLLSRFGLNHETIDAVVFSSRYMPKGMDRDGLLRAYGEDKGGLEVLKNRLAGNNWYKVLTAQPMRNRTGLRANMEVRKSSLSQYGISPDRIHFLDHHLSHASAAYYGLRRDNAPYLVLTLDGGGDALCATVSIGKGGKITRTSETAEGHSIGNIYSRITFLMGFVPWEHEYKLMGMAPYASRERSGKVRDAFAGYLDLDAGSPMSFRKKIPESTMYIAKRLEQDIRGVRFDDICGGLQLFTEDLIVRWVRECVRQTGVKRVLCSGGVFMNVKANKRILELPEVDTISVFPSCGDETNSIGAAFFWASQNGDDVARLSHFYTGPDFHNGSLTAEIEKSSLPHRRFEDINEKVAELLANREIVARCTGPMEFGARALGNRSILADPSYYDSVRVINRMVKKRDFWMPFAPVIKEERLQEYVSNPKNAESPFMMLTFDTTEKRSDFMAAVHNADLTARAQILSRQANPQFYDLLAKYEAKTGSGVLLNTSFNLHGYPIVLGPKEAIDVFINSGLKYLALEDYLLWK